MSKVYCKDCKWKGSKYSNKTSEQLYNCDHPRRFIKPYDELDVECECCHRINRVPVWKK